MTGIERLRELARRRDTLVVPSVHGTYCAGYVAATEDMSEQLSAIADQIEREQESLVADSPYDAILPEDREAVAWVREHGGLDAVRSEWSSRVPYDKHEQRRQRLLGHIAECETALGRRNQRIEELGKHIQSLTTENADMRKRLMPEGMEWLVEAWPRFEDDSPVRLEDEWCPRTGGTTKVGQVVLAVDWSFAINASWYEPGERIKRPAPKVLDADGVEIRVGDTVWHVETGEQCKVVEVYSKSVSVDFRVDGDGTKHTGSILPTNLTHRAPVIAADGRPLREGEHVYHVETGVELVVKELPKPGEYQAVVVFAPPASHLTSFDPDQLTHERPDSFSLIEQDSELTPYNYALKYGKPDGVSNGKFQRVDHVRRCKAQAEKEG